MTDKQTTRDNVYVYGHPIIATVLSIPTYVAVELWLFFAFAISYYVIGITFRSIIGISAIYSLAVMLDRVKRIQLAKKQESS